MDLKSIIHADCDLHALGEHIKNNTIRAYAVVAEEHDFEMHFIHGFRVDFGQWMKKHIPGYLCIVFYSGPGSMEEFVVMCDQRCSRMDYTSNISWAIFWDKLEF